MTTSYYQQPSYLAPETRARSVDINALNDATKAAFDAIPASDQVWKGVHDFTGGKVRVPAPVIVSDAATKGYVDTLLMSSQGKFAPPPAVGTYVFGSTNGAAAWVPAPNPAIFDDATRIAQAQATALSF